jgi:hypothetical protein
MDTKMGQRKGTVLLGAMDKIVQMDPYPLDAYCINDVSPLEYGGEIVIQ